MHGVVSCLRQVIASDSIRCAELHARSHVSPDKEVGIGWNRSGLCTAVPVLLWFFRKACCVSGEWDVEHVIRRCLLCGGGGDQVRNVLHSYVGQRDERDFQKWTRVWCGTHKCCLVFGPSALFKGNSSPKMEVSPNVAIHWKHMLTMWGFFLPKYPL